MYTHDGSSRAWHYDYSDFVVTLMIQPPQQGGKFEFAPFNRGTPLGDERYMDLKRAFNRLMKSEAGMIDLFYRQRSLHRVRNVFGPQKRILAVLSYDSVPGRQAQPKKNVMLYGDQVRSIFQQRGVDV